MLDEALDHPPRPREFGPSRPSWDEGTVRTANAQNPEPAGDIFEPADDRPAAGATLQVARPPAALAAGTSARGPARPTGHNQSVGRRVPQRGHKPGSSSSCEFARSDRAAREGRPAGRRANTPHQTPPGVTIRAGATGVRAGSGSHPANGPIGKNNDGSVRLGERPRRPRALRSEIFAGQGASTPPWAREQGPPDHRGAGRPAVGSPKTALLYHYAITSPTSSTNRPVHAGRGSRLLRYQEPPTPPEWSEPRLRGRIKPARARRGSSRDNRGPASPPTSSRDRGHHQQRVPARRALEKRPRLRRLASTGVWPHDVEAKATRMESAAPQPGHR